MSTTDDTEVKTRQSKVVEKEDDITADGQTVSVSSSEQVMAAVEDESTEGKQEEENQTEQDPQMDVEVKGNTPTVKMSWESNGGEGEDVPSEEISSSGQMAAAKNLENCEEHPEVTSSSVTEEAPCQTAETKEEQEVEECRDKEESQMDVVIVEDDSINVDQSAPAAAVTCGNENEQVKSEVPEKKTKKRKKKADKKTAVNGKRAADSTSEPSPPKKTRIEDDEFCLCVGNLNTLRTFPEVKTSLESFFMNQSFTFKEIRFTRSKKHAYISLTSETDLATALKLDGEMILDKPMKVTKANVLKQDEEKAPTPAPALTRKERNGRCLFVTNLPVTTTKKRIMKLFSTAIEVTFPGGKELPTRGKAFVAFPDKASADKVLQRKGLMLKGQALTLSPIGGVKKEKDQKTNVKENTKDENTKAATPGNHTLHVGNLTNKVKADDLQKAFPKATSVNIPQSKRKGRSFAFVEFETVKEAENALNASQNLMICGKAAKVQFCDQPRPKDSQVLTKTLFVMGLAAKTTAETLQIAFEGASSARVAVDHGTGCSKGFGFVDFDSEETCKAAKDAMRDCLIDGKKVTVANARAKEKKGHPEGRGGSTPRQAGQTEAPKAAKKGCNEKGSKGVGEKRKAESTPKSAPPKKPKVLNDGFCLFVGNLNASKSNEEIKTSLATYLMNQSLLFEDIRLDRSKKHAFVDLASEVDLNKALILNGASILDKPVKISKAKTKGGEEVKTEAPPAAKKGGGKKKRGKKGKKGGSQAQVAVEEVKPDN